MNFGAQVTDEIFSRRELLLRGGAGFGALALSGMLARDKAFADAGSLAPGQAHFAPKAKNVIFLFMEGGPSHIDLFDPKPLLNKLAGQRMPESFKRPITAMGETESPLLASPRTWKRHGQSGAWVSDWLPHTAGCVDDLAVIRSCWTNGINHSGGVCQMNTGQPLAGRPSLGSWVNYGLGTANENLPAFVGVDLVSVITTNAKSTPTNGPRNWSAGFMPAAYQGIRLSPGAEPFRHLNIPKGVTPATHRRKLELLRRLNEQHRATREHQSELEARIRSYELAYRMQSAAPEAVDLSRESEATRRLYGFGNRDTEPFGRCCLLARRMVERGVRFVQIYHGAGSKWDSHSKMEENHSRQCRQSDLPTAGLLKDLKSRGLLEETLVIWGGEFGRTPMSEARQTAGRNHHIDAFTMWMAGGGIKPGNIVGETDEFGFGAIDQECHVHDLHATVLHQLGLDHKRLTFRFQGRDFRLTDVQGNVIQDALA